MKGIRSFRRRKLSEQAEQSGQEEQKKPEKPEEPLKIPGKYFDRLAYLAQLGDVHAMQMLGVWFRRRLSVQYLKLEAAWEEDPQEYQEKFTSYAKKHKEEIFFARAGILWLVRAAAFGNSEAANLVSMHKRWDRLSLIPERFLFPRMPVYPGVLFTTGPNDKIKISGLDLRKAGFLEFSEENYEITSIGYDGTYCAKTDAHDRIGPDEDGFGMELLYNFYVFDEFFHCVRCTVSCSIRDYMHGNDYFGEKYAREKKEMYLRQRERYWGGALLQEESVKYEYLPSEFEGALIRNGVLRCYVDYGETEYVIPETVNAIGFEAFCGNKHLEKIVVPETVRYIEARAFANSWLTEIRIPRGTKIGKKAFYMCRHLKSAVIDEGVAEIGEEAFSECKELVYCYKRQVMATATTHSL